MNQLPTANVLTTETPISDVMALWAAHGGSDPNKLKFGEHWGKAALVTWCKAAEFDTGGAVGMWLLQTLDPGEALEVLQLQAEKAKEKAVADAKAAKGTGGRRKVVRLGIGSGAHKTTVSLSDAPSTIQTGTPYMLARTALAAITQLRQVCDGFDLNPDNVETVATSGKEFNPVDREANKANREKLTAEYMEKGMSEDDAKAKAAKADPITKRVEMDVESLYYPGMKGGKLCAATDIVKGGKMLYKAAEVFPRHHAVLLRFLEFCDAIAGDEELSAMIDGCNEFSWMDPAPEASDNDND